MLTFIKPKAPRFAYFFILLLISFLEMQAQAEFPLYDGEIPNARLVANLETSRYIPDSILIIDKVSRPTLTIYIPTVKKPNGAAVIICPGGGYVNLAAGYEGSDVAKKFNESGITAFVLKYRIPDDGTMIRKEIGPLQDAQRAIQLVRLKAGEWGIDPERIGIMGFSAGGHLASTAGTHFMKEYVDNPTHISLRPDFMILIYPVISFREPLVHKGSMYNLLGQNPAPVKIIEYSNEMQVTDLTPKTFLVHAKDDDAVPYENSTAFADSLRKKHIHFELYLYDRGGHGFGMNNKASQTQWMDLCIQWMGKEGFIKK